MAGRRDRGGPAWTLLDMPYFSECHLCLRRPWVRCASVRCTRAGLWLHNRRRAAGRYSCPLFFPDTRQAPSTALGRRRTASRHSLARRSNSTNIHTTSTLLSPSSATMVNLCDRWRPPSPSSAPSRGSSTFRLALGTRRRRPLCLAERCPFGPGATRHAPFGPGAVPLTSQLASFGGNVEPNMVPESPRARCFCRRRRVRGQVVCASWRGTGELVTPAREHSLSPSLRRR